MNRNIKSLEQVIRDTITAMERGKEEIFRIAEAAREECAAVEREVEQIKQAVAEQVRLVDELERQDRKARLRLLDVSRDFQKYGEQDVKEAYEKAREIQVQLGVARERERFLRQQRDQLERRLKYLMTMLERAEALASQVGVAMGYLVNDLKDLPSQFANMEKSRGLGLSIIKAQEEERRRVAREIHDGPAQLLANVVLRIDVCQRLAAQDVARLQEELGQLKDLVRLSLQDVRKIIFNLRPMALDDLGLVPALRGYLKDYQEKSGLETDLVFFGTDRRFETTFEVALFRLIQEALTNVVKHAQAKRVWVKIDIGNREIKMSVKDDGRGFDVEKARQEAAGTKFGLVGMRERTELLGGRMDITSSPGLGTRINFFVPLPE